MEKSEAVQKYREMYQYMIDKNTNALSDLLDESFVLVHMTVIPFCTNEGSGIGNTVKELQEYCKGAKVESGKSRNC